MRDLRISVTDRCNLRCRYCMPAEVFGPNFEFLPRSEILSFEEIVRLVQIAVPLGVRKVRLTGGEPLLRRGLSDLVGTLAAVADVEDLAITTNGILLPHHAEELRAAGLGRVTVSLDAMDPDIFARMNGVGAKVSQRYQFEDGAGEVGIIASVTKPFCRDCNRLRVSAVDKLFTCLFAQQGHDLRRLLRSGADGGEIRETLARIWNGRDDRYFDFKEASRLERLGD